MQATGDAPPLIIADRLADEVLWSEVLNLGAYDLLMKPFEQREVLHVLANACRSCRRDPERRNGMGKPVESAGRNTLSTNKAGAA